MIWFDATDEHRTKVLTCVTAGHLEVKNGHHSEWDGSRIREGLRKLPPGQYMIESIDEAPQLTEPEERGILGSLDELDAGLGIPLTDLVRETRGSTP